MTFLLTERQARGGRTLTKQYTAQQVAKNLGAYERYDGPPLSRDQVVALLDIVLACWRAGLQEGDCLLRLQGIGQVSVSGGVVRQNADGGGLLPRVRATVRLDHNFRAEFRARHAEQLAEIVDRKEAAEDRGNQWDWDEF